MKRGSRGFSLMELMVVLVVVGIIAAIAVSNYVSMRARAQEASTKSNMHTFQIAAEDYGVRYTGVYATDASQAAALLTQGGSTFYNPFNRATGNNQAWVDQPTWASTLSTGSTLAGIVAYGDSAGTKYQVAGRGVAGDLPLILTSGR